MTIGSKQAKQCFTEGHGRDTFAKAELYFGPG